MVLWLLIAWVVVTLILISLVVYRAALTVREDDQIYINPIEEGRREEQRALTLKLDRLRGPIIGLVVVSVVLLLTTCGVWVYLGFKS